MEESEQTAILEKRTECIFKMLDLVVCESWKHCWAIYEGVKWKHRDFSAEVPVQQVWTPANCCHKYCTQCFKNLLKCHACHVKITHRERQSDIYSMTLINHLLELLQAINPGCVYVSRKQKRSTLEAIETKVLVSPAVGDLGSQNLQEFSEQTLIPEVPSLPAINLVGSSSHGASQNTVVANEMDDKENVGGTTKRQRTRLSKGNSPNSKPATLRKANKVLATKSVARTSVSTRSCNQQTMENISSAKTETTTVTSNDCLKVMVPETKVCKQKGSDHRQVDLSPSKKPTPVTMDLVEREPTEVEKPNKRFFLSRRLKSHSKDSNMTVIKKGDDNNAMDQQKTNKKVTFSEFPFQKPASVANPPSRVPTYKSTIPSWDTDDDDIYEFQSQSKRPAKTASGKRGRKPRDTAQMSRNFFAVPPVRRRRNVCKK